MRLDFAFRLANYVTLALACICLTQVEAAFLPSIGWFLPPLLALVATAFVVEERWNLPTWAANLLAVLVTAGIAADVAYEMQRDSNSFVATAPLPIALMPYAGPELMALLVIKLFRPKRLVDYWQLQGMGLLIVALTCVLGHDPLVGLLLAAYFVAALWCLALFAVHRQPRGAGSTSKQVAIVPWPGYGVPRAVGWVVMAMAGGVLLALVTPRQSASQWNPLELLGKSPAGARGETGISSWIDLNRTGQIEVNEEVVLEIQAEDQEQQPKTDLDSEQRWRGMFLDQYENGRWRLAQPRRIVMAGTGMERLPPGGGGSALPLSKEMYRNGKGGMNDAQKAGTRPGGDFPDEFFEPGGARGVPHPQRISSSTLPNLGSDAYYLTFSLNPRKAGGFFLADPVWLLPEHVSLPVQAIETPAGTGPIFTELHGGIMHSAASRGLFQYRQITIPLKHPDLGPPIELDRDYQGLLVSPPPPSLIAWTDNLLKTLLAKPGIGLRADELKLLRDGEMRLLHPAQREKVARILCDHLKYSGEYTYTLDLKREDPDMDPTEDFLRNVKQGHCERYAGALALMLRAEGIPARVVKGFRGCESLGDGRYQVRNSQAHAWVEAVVSRPGPSGQPRLHWLALDPVAVQEAPASAPFSFSRWWQDCERMSLEVWRVFVVDYSAEEQEALASGVWNAVTSSRSSGNGGRFPVGILTAGAGILAVAGFTIVAVWLFRRAGKRRKVSAALVLAPPVPFYARFLHLLATHVHLQPTSGQTPHEFGSAAARHLYALLGSNNLAALPEQIVARFYRVRYGGESISEAEERAIDGCLDALATALAAAPHVAMPSTSA